MVSFSHYASLLLTLLIFSALTTKSSSQSFKCSSASAATCYSLIDYVSPNTTTLTAITTLFSVESFHSFLGANDFPLSTSPNQTVRAQQKIKIPFPCICRNETGLSNGKPVYTVQKDDGLWHIAAEVFSGLVTSQQIAGVNNITDVNLIEVGQELWIPLPCSCDDVDGERVVHYGHMVEAGSSLGLIAQEYGTTRDTLMRLNGIANESSLQAGQVLDVPLRACNSSVRRDSMDYPLLVANDAYVVTANGCVKCKCEAAKNWTLQCEPSGLKPSNWTSCPAIQCQLGENNVLRYTTTSTFTCNVTSCPDMQCQLGESSGLYDTATNTCNITTCAYAGFYQNQTILTTLATSTYPDTTSPSNASRMGLTWNFVFMSIPVLLLSVHLL